MGLKLFPKMIIIGLTILLVCMNEGFAYDPPHAKVEPLWPKGIRISVPDEEGISLVAFHVKINDEFYSLEAGTIAVDVIKARNGRWTYQDKNTVLKKYDVVYYWVHVVYKGLGYNLLDQEHKVVEFYNLDGTVHETGPVTPGPDGSCQARSETWVMEGNTPQRKPCQGDLIFEEEFDNLDANRWTAIEKFPGAPDYEFVVYQNSDKNVKVENGRLQISPTLLDDIYGPTSVRHGKLVLDRCTGAVGTSDCEREARGFHILPPVISGRINTKSSFSFIYGRIEIRAKLPRGDWIYPLMSLESADNANTGSFNEMRIACVAGNEELKTSEDHDIGNHVLWASKMSIDLNSNNHNFSSLERRSNLQQRFSSSFWSDDYHNYEMIWSPNRILFKVDGVQYGEQESGRPFDAPFYVNLGLAVGGHTEFPDGSRSRGYAKPWQNDGPKALLDFYKARDDWAKTWSRSTTPLVIDYVKIWAL